LFLVAERAGNKSPTIQEKKSFSPYFIFNENVGFETVLPFRVVQFGVFYCMHDGKTREKKNPLVTFVLPRSHLIVPSSAL
jgi:hypothetical protein